jgi:uridylate kinase
MESIVINIGGSVILSENIDNSYFKELKELLEKISKNNKIFIVIGGGKIARTYISYGRQYDLNEKILDQIGIDVTRINAKLFSYILGIPNIKIPFTTEEAKKIDSPIVVMGGTVPGHSTDMVGAELAEKVNASKFIIATNVDGVYDKDPNKYEDAKQLKEVYIKQLIEKYGTDWTSAGKNVVIDGPALEIIYNAKLPTFVLNGKKISELEKLLYNKEFNGTVIKI